jgi:hypothetical protein
MAGDGLLRRLRRRRIDPGTLVSLPDSHPKRGLIAEPVRIERIDHEATDPVDPDELRVTFLVEVRSSDDARCPAVAVEARVTGPERERTVSGATDMLGRIRFRMTGPAGTYRLEITDVAAGGLDWDRDRSRLDLAVDLDR